MAGVEKRYSITGDAALKIMTRVYERAAQIGKPAVYIAVVDGTVPDELEVTARTDGGVIMALRHREAPVLGVQYHPESVLTEGGYRMLGNWLASTGLPEAAERAVSLSPLVKLS